MKKIIWLFILISFPLKPDDNNTFQDWSLFLGEFSEELSGVTSRQTLSQSLFNLFSEVGGSVYSFKLPQTPLDVGFGINVAGGRNIIFNGKIDNSYTVIDKFLIGLNPNVSASYMGVSGGLGITNRFLVTNIRQVGIRDYENFSTLEKKIEDLKDSLKKENAKNYSTEQLSLDNETYEKFFSSGEQKVERRATLGKIWNPLTMVFRLPLSPQAAERMEDDEILGYTLTGGVTMSAGFGVGGGPGNILRFGVDASVVFKGIFEIVVLKEKPEKPGENFVRVKIGRNKGIGLDLGLGSHDSIGIDSLLKGHMGFLEGNFIWHLSGVLVNFRPFRISYNKSYWKLFNQSYRFDLNDEQARSAYQKAVLGNFKMAQELYSKSGPINKILSVKEQREISGYRNSIRMFIFNLEKDGVIRKSDKIITDQDDDEQIMKEIEIISSRYWNFLFKIKEKKTHNFLVSVNMGKFLNETKESNALTLKVQAERQDSHTTTKEYLEYKKEIESALNKPGILPDPPLTEGKTNLAVGNLSFNYQLKFNWPQIEKLINYPVEDMWPALITAFGAEDEGWEDPSNRKKLIAKAAGIYLATVPVSLVGSKFPPKDNIIVASIKKYHWQRLKTAQLKGVKALLDELGKFFKTGDYGPEMVKLLQVVCLGEKIPYRMRVSSSLLGEETSIMENQIGEVELEDIMNPLTYNTYFEKVSVRNLFLEIISNEYVRVSFDLDKDPYSLFLNLQKVNMAGVLSNSSLGVVVIRNQGQFKIGKNTLMIKLGDKRKPLGKLFGQMKMKKSVFIPYQYRLDMAGSLDGKRYGWTTSNLFRPIYTQDKYALKKYISLTVEDLNLCMGMTALNLILFLEKRPYMVCPPEAPRHADGTCVQGMYPYDFIVNGTLQKNLLERDEWILKNCPREGSKEYIAKVIKSENACLGRKGKELIAFLGDRILMVCPPHLPKNSDGTCVTGIIPYPWREETDNIPARNDWILKYCD